MENKIHDELNALATLCQSINYHLGELEEKGNAFKNTKKLVECNKKLVERARNLIDQLFLKAIKEKNDSKNSTI